MEQSRGFTLPELITSVAIVAILSSTALPSFSGLVARHAVTTDANILLSIVLFARSEAIKRNTPVVICRSNDGVSCLGRSDGRWNDGVVVFADDGRDAGGSGVDANRRGNGAVDPGEAILRTEHPLTGHCTIAGGPTSGQLRFDGDGRPYGVAPTTFLLSANVNARAERKLIVSATGRPRVVAP